MRDSILTKFRGHSYEKMTKNVFHFNHFGKIYLALFKNSFF
jgi:hypothetical protein